MKRSIITLSSIAILGFSMLSFTNSNGFEISKQVEVFVSFFMKLNQNYVDKTNPAELMDTAIKAITKELDPYTKFWTEQDIEASKIRNSGQYTGIGSAIHIHDKRLYISEPYKGFPADKSGLKAGDEIIQIDDILVSDYKGDAKDLLKGETGSTVKVTIARQGKTEIVDVVRSKIDVDAVPFYQLLDDNTAYIVLQKFNKKASSQTIAALKELKAKGADKVILDLRANPGGLLTEAVNVCNIFVAKGEKIVHTESVIDSYKKIYKTKNEPIDEDIPLVVLINGRSASASEIVSGVIQDLDRGVVIGARSFGKGLVQSTRKLKYNTLLKVTTSRYFIPSGRCIQALDYWNRDEDDKPVRTKDSDYKAFKTLNSKRTVYDGGGVLPDIEIDVAKRSSIASVLLKEKAIFDFATDFYYKTKIDDISKFHFSEADYKDFLNYLHNTNFTYKTKTERTLEEAMVYAEKEDLEGKIQNEYKSLLNGIKASKEKALEDQAREIKQLLTNEILKRYFYAEGKYQYDVIHSDEIKEAKSVLANSNVYNKILTKK